MVYSRYIQASHHRRVRTQIDLEADVLGGCHATCYHELWEGTASEATYSDTEHQAGHKLPGQWWFLPWLVMLFQTLPLFHVRALHPIPAQASGTILKMLEGKRDTSAG